METFKALIDITQPDSRNLHFCKFDSSAQDGLTPITLEDVHRGLRLGAMARWDHLGPLPTLGRGNRISAATATMRRGQPPLGACTSRSPARRWPQTTGSAFGTTAGSKPPR